MCFNCRWSPETVDRVERKKEKRAPVLVFRCCSHCDPSEHHIAHFYPCTECALDLQRAE